MKVRTIAAATLAATLVFAAAPALAGAVLPGEAPQAQAAGAKWVKSGGYYKYRKAGGTYAKGLTTIGTKTYYFDKKRRQVTGWVKLKGGYRFFRYGNGARSCMATNTVVNGIKLGPAGEVVNDNKTARRELSLMVRAAKIVRAETKPSDSVSKKVKKLFTWMLTDVRECSSRKIHIYSGWHRPYATDILKHKRGNCDSFAAGYAYLANACGVKKCYVVTSIGHSWTEINGNVYDSEWSTWTYRVYNLPYSRSGGKYPMYKGNRSYVVKIAGRKKLWGGNKSDAASGKSGLKKENGAYCYYVGGKKATGSWVTLKGKTYYFTASGKAAIGAKKVKGTYYVFGEKGALLTGKKTREVSVNGVTYRVAKDGTAVGGLSDDKARCYLPSGRLVTGVMYSGRFYAASDDGAYDASLTKSLRAACKLGGDATQLLALLGEPVKTSETDSCNLQYGEGSKDRLYTYAHVRVSTIVAPGGAEYLTNAEAR